MTAGGNSENNQQPKSPSKQNNPIFMDSRKARKKPYPTVNGSGSQAKNEISYRN